MSFFNLVKDAFRAAGAIVFAASALVANAETITMASTTSTEQSGLFAHLLPAFKQASNIDIKVVAVGTGQAIDMAKRGDADVLFVHDTAAEEKFVAEGFAARRFPVMYNDFVLVGPGGQPVPARRSPSRPTAVRQPDCTDSGTARLGRRLGW